jgi:hypothetical protein
MNPRLEAALQYASRGWHVFPLVWIVNDWCSCRNPECNAPGKHPRLKGGFYSATTDRELIESWWKRWPRANIGIRTGQISNLLVIDIDGKRGVETFGALCAENGTPTFTYRVLTGKGWHLYYAMPPDLQVDSSKGDGVDVRCEKGYVVAPPSNHISGNLYQPDPDVRWQVQSVVPPAWGTWAAARVPRAPSAEPLNLGERPPYLTVDHGIVWRALKDFGIEWSREIEDLLNYRLSFVASDDRRLWVRYGLALHTAHWDFNGDNRGYAIWLEWSRKSDKYSEYQCEKEWLSFGKTEANHPKKITISSILKETAVYGNPVREIEPEPLETEHKPGTNGHASADALFSELKPSAKPGNPLIQLNDKHAVIGDVGSKCLVLSWVHSKVDEDIKVPSFQSFKSFAERYAHRYVMVKTEKKDGETVEEPKQLGTHWLKWPRRRTYEGIDLVPNGPVDLPGGYLNLWSGFAVPPTAGAWPLMRAHIHGVLASMHEESAQYIMRWAAWAVQNPDRRAEVALVFRGGKGSGKGTFANALKMLFGQHGLQIYNSKHLVGNFNGHLRNCLLLFADEAFWAGDKAGESTLKGMLTESNLVIEQKGVDAVAWKNRLHVIMAANAEWVVPASHDERRYAMFDVSDARVGDRAYFQALHTELAGGGLAAMLHELMTLDLEGWHPRQIVETEALRQQKERSMDVRWAWFESLLQQGWLPNASENTPGETTAGYLMEDIREFDSKFSITPTGLGRFLRARGCRNRHTRAGAVWLFPDLKIARVDFIRHWRAWKWDENIEKWVAKSKVTGSTHHDSESRHEVTH